MSCSQLPLRRDDHIEDGDRDSVVVIECIARVIDDDRRRFGQHGEVHRVVFRLRLVVEVPVHDPVAVVNPLGDRVAVLACRFLGQGVPARVPARPGRARKIHENP